MCTGVGDGQGGLECCSPWGRKKSDTAEQLNSTELIAILLRFQVVVLSKGLFSTWRIVDIPLIINAISC